MNQSVNSDPVSMNFAGLLSALDCRIDDFKVELAEASLGDLQGAEHTLSIIRELESFRTEAAAFSKRWSKFIDRIHAKKPITELIAGRKKNGRSRLRVTLNGEIIEKATSAATFVEALFLMSLDRVAKLNENLSGATLVSHQRPKGYQTYSKIGEWYVINHANNVTKKALLEKVADKLSIAIKVEIV
jgi:hypothetical protein